MMSIKDVCIYAMCIVDDVYRGCVYICYVYVVDDVDQGYVYIGYVYVVDDVY